MKFINIKIYSNYIISNINVSFLSQKNQMLIYRLATSKYILKTCIPSGVLLMKNKSVNLIKYLANNQVNNIKIQKEYIILYLFLFINDLIKFNKGILLFNGN